MHENNVRLCVSLWTWIHRTNELKISWEGQRALRPADRDHFIFHWLPSTSGTRTGSSHHSLGMKIMAKKDKIKGIFQEKP
jgi:hypothetical protein